jgi:hypothetical protein
MRIGGRIGLLAAGACMLMPACAAPASLAASVNEVRQAQAQVVGVFAGRSDFPEEPIARLKFEKTLYWSAAEDGWLLAPVTITYKGVPDSYCRLVTVKRGSLQATLIALPPAADAPDCKRFNRLYHLDINGDGQLDIAASVLIASNRFDGIVEEAAVYLSSPGQPGGYCYSEAASRNLAPAQLASGEQVAEALRRERARLGLEQFGCAAAGP